MRKKRSKGTNRKRGGDKDKRMITECEEEKVRKRPKRNMSRRRKISKGTDRKRGERKRNDR